MNVNLLAKNLVVNTTYLVSMSATVEALKRLIGKVRPDFWNVEEEFETLDEFLAANPLDEAERKEIARRKVVRVAKVMGVSVLISAAGLIVGTIVMSAMEQQFFDLEDEAIEAPF